MCILVCESATCVNVTLFLFLFFLSFSFLFLFLRYLLRVGARQYLGGFCQYGVEVPLYQQTQQQLVDEEQVVRELGAVGELAAPPQGQEVVGQHPVHHLGPEHLVYPLFQLEGALGALLSSGGGAIAVAQGETEEKMSRRVAE
jgi:hypothetical protein